MSKIENDKLRKIRNKHFIRAFEYLARELRLTQGELAEKIGSKSAYISKYRNLVRPVPEETMMALIRISSKYKDLQIYSGYLYGNSDVMLYMNVTDEEFRESNKRSDPDYEVLAQQGKGKQTESKSVIDPSSTMNAALSAQMAYIEHLKDELNKKEEEMNARLADKENIIDSLRKQLKEKDDYIAILKEQIKHLSSQLNQQGFKEYPFPVGVADERKKQHKR